MAKETRYNKKFKDHSPKTLKIFLVENRIGTGMPDMDGINRKGKGFKLEGKHLDEFPKRLTTCPLKGAFEKGQLGWIAAWKSWGGEGFVLLHVGTGHAGKFYLVAAAPELESVPLGELKKYILADGIDACVTYLENL